MKERPVEKLRATIAASAENGDRHERQQTLAVRGYRGRPSTEASTAFLHSWSRGLRSGTSGTGTLDSHVHQRPAGNPWDVFCFSQQPQEVHR
jgi:hypothetical protein